MAALFIMIAASVQDAASRMHIVVQSASVDAAQVFAACLTHMSQRTSSMARKACGEPPPGQLWPLVDFIAVA